MGSSISTTPKATAATSSISAEERWAIIERLSQEYFETLSSQGGFVLTAEQRVHNSTLTLNGTLHCPACARLPKEACLKPGNDLYQAIAQGHGDINQQQDDDNDDEIILVHMIHSIVNHQSKISQDPSWYHTTMAQLQATTTLLDETRMKQEGLVSDQQREYLYYGLFVEIVMVTAAVHCLHMVTIMKGTSPPTIIPAKKDASPPVYLDWSQIFRKNKSATHDPHRATMPYIARSDIDENSPLLFKLFPDAKDRQTLFSPGMVPMAPFLCITWDPVDFLWMERLDDVLYVSVDDFFAPHQPLNGKVRCADHFSRRDIETIAVAVSEGYQCDF
jgi:hypothetical protein